mmetsp:Transcript_2351/g.8163  ORF Transcript_2351/g.8163 Transcript_2351/m.8163 type:complete len:324 (+) Transcript_2351:634-1605(+)
MHELREREGGRVAERHLAGGRLAACRRRRPSLCGRGGRRCGGLEDERRRSEHLDGVACEQRRGWRRRGAEVHDQARHHLGRPPRLSAPRRPAARLCRRAAALFGREVVVVDDKAVAVVLLSVAPARRVGVLRLVIRSELLALALLLPLVLGLDLVVERLVAPKRLAPANRAGGLGPRAVVRRPLRLLVRLEELVPGQLPRLQRGSSGRLLAPHPLAPLERRPPLAPLCRSPRAVLRAAGEHLVQLLDAPPRRQPQRRQQGEVVRLLVRADGAAAADVDAPEGRLAARGRARAAPRRAIRSLLEPGILGCRLRPCRRRGRRGRG